MDFSKFKIHDWLMIGGGAAMLILGMALDWSSYGGYSGDGPFDYFFTGGLAWILVVAVGVLALLNVLGKLPAAQPWPLIFLGASGLAAILMILRIILGGRDVGGFNVDRGTGMYAAVVWTGISVAGAFLNFTASGGNLNDLKDMDKLKSSFSKGDGDVPPPPAPPAPPTPEL